MSRSNQGSGSRNLAWAQLSGLAGQACLIKLLNLLASKLGYFQRLLACQALCKALWTP